MGIKVNYIFVISSTININIKNPFWRQYFTICKEVKLIFTLIYFYKIILKPLKTVPPNICLDPWIDETYYHLVRNPYNGRVMTRVLD